MPITFDPYAGPPRLINITLPDTEVTIQNLVNAARDWSDELSNLQHPIVLSAAGKEDLGGGVLVGITVTLLNWKLKFADRPGSDYVLCNIRGGNLVAVDGNGDPMSAIEPAAYVTVSLTASSSATLQELTSVQHSSFNNGVMIDVVNGVSGTAFPTGTGEQPVDNLADAKTIAQLRGFRIIYVRGNITFTATDNIDGYDIHGEAHIASTITVQSGCSTELTGFHHVTLEGTLSGETDLVSCLIGGGIGLFGFEGEALNCVLTGDVALGGTGLVQFLDCWSGVPGNLTPEIDMNGDGPELGFRAYAGGVLLKNKTGTSSVSLDFISGQAIIDSTVTNGTIVIRGTAKVTDNSVGADVDITNVVNPYRVSDTVWDELGADHIVSGSLGKLLNDIGKTETGRWKMQNNQLIIYDPADDTTPIFTFNLFDDAGQPSMTKVYERVPV